MVKISSILHTSLPDKILFTFSGCIYAKLQIAISLKTSHYLIFIVRDAMRAKTLADALRNFANYKDDCLCYSTKSDAPGAPLKLF